MKQRNDLLGVGIVLPLVLLFWPFARWGMGMSLVLRVIPSVSLQILLCKTVKSRVVKLLPVVFTGLFAAWGTYLYMTSSHWSRATAAGLLMDYVSPFFSCAVVYVILQFQRKNK